MNALRIIINIIMILVSAGLIAVVLLQKTSSGGLGSAFGGDTQSFTARGKAASMEAKLQKITIICAIVIGVASVLLMIIG